MRAPLSAASSPARDRAAVKHGITAAYLLFALLAVLIVGLHTDHFIGRPYRQDEAWIVHGALEKFGAGEIVQWVSTNIHPPLWVMTANAWVDVFGQNEAVTRTLSGLLTLLALAFVFRLGADLAGSVSSPVAPLAVFLLGTSTFFQFYAHEFRPYPALAACTLAAMLTFLRWIRHPDFRHALLFVAAGVAALYVHFFAVYVLAALALFYLVFVRWQPRHALTAFGLFAAIGASYLAWLLPFVHALIVTNPGGIDYALDSTGNTVLYLLRLMSLRPYEIAAFLAITSLLLAVRGVSVRRSRVRQTPAQQRFRLDPLRRRVYPLVIGAFTFSLAFAVNSVTANLTQRSLIILMPMAALFLAFGAAALPRAARFALVLVLLPWLFTFIDYEYPGPQAEVAAYMSPMYQLGSPVIMNVPYVPRQVALLYYIQNRMDAPVPNALVWQVIAPNQAYIDFLPYTPVHQMNRANPTTLAALGAFLDDAAADQVWLIERAGGNPLSASIRSVIEQHYTLDSERAWEREYTALRFHR